jgi:hypothetical protein
MLPKIIDNSLDTAFVNDVETFLFSNYFPWYFVDNIAMKGLINNHYLQVGFSHVFYGDENKNSYNYENFEQLKTIVTTNMTGTIERARTFLHIPVPQEIRTPHDTVHVDFHHPHTVCLYYVNDSDGDTIIYDKTYNDGDPNQPMNVVERISPKKGRVIIFDGSYYHCATPPTSNPRCIINFNVL